SDQDWRLAQRADQPIVVIDDLVDADLGESGIRGRTQLGRRAVVERPGRGDNGITPSLVTGLEAFPALRVQPGAMDEHDGFGHWSFLRSRWSAGLAEPIRVASHEAAIDQLFKRLRSSSSA